MRWLALALCALAACYSPRIDRCKITCTDSCPSAEQDCLADHFCHAAGDTDMCMPDAEPDPDLDGTPAPDAEPDLPVFRTVTVGGHHACAIDMDGALWCWGSNLANQLGIDQPAVRRRTAPTQVGTDTTWTAVDAGDMHTCGINAGKLYCWGGNSYGQAIDQQHGSGEVVHPEENDTGPTSGWIAVTTSGNGTCALHDDGDGTTTIYCAGADDTRQRGDGGGDDTGPALTPIAVTTDGVVDDWSAVSAGSSHVCALRPNGDAYCWGQNNGGQIGDGFVGGLRNSPARVGASVEDGAVGFAAIAPGNVMTCALGKDAFAGRLYCWGDNGYGQLGSASLSSAPSPRRIGMITDWTRIAAGYLVTCGSRPTGVQCWGEGSAGTTGDGAWSYQSTPQAVQGLGTDMIVAVGYQAACAVPGTGGVKCWGNNAEGELGNGETSTKHVPTAIAPSDGAWTEVRAGLAHTCGIHAGTVMCWGWNEAREVNGAGSPDMATTPTVVSGLAATATELSVSRYASCAIIAGKPWCWGSNDNGEVGVAGNPVPPTQIASSGTWRGLTQTQDAACALQGVDRWCWGNGAAYGFGDNGIAVLSTPASVDGDWNQVSLGSRFGCGIDDATKNLECWGTDSFSTQGDGPTHTDAHTPHTIGSATWGSVAAAWSGDHACAIEALTQDLWCWGRDDYGQCGVTSGVELNVPTLVDAGTWVAIAAGPLHTCGIKAAPPNGELWCWGAHSDDQLGVDQLQAYFDAPLRIGTDTGWTQVSAGAFHTCGLRDGNLYCWGANLHGQIGDGTSAHATPVTVAFP